MPTILSKGFKKPLTGETGATFFPALEENIQQLNDHNHDGVNSNTISAASISPVFHIINAAASGGWTTPVNGVYEKTITVPVSLLYDNVSPQFRDTATGSTVLLHTLKVTPTTYKVYSNDANLNLRIFYLT